MVTIPRFLKKRTTPDRIFRLARIWSNKELQKIAHLFEGHVVNVSGWKDIDKQGRHYADYFHQAKSYTITNYKSEARGFQGFENEVFLDLTSELDPAYHEKFDVVFNHTVLEHIYESRSAFANLCKMSKDIVIVVVPFLQQMHADYGDYWRFTPLTMKSLYEENGLDLMYLNFNSHPNASVYLFCVGSKNQDKWLDKIEQKFNYVDPNPANTGFENYVGCHAISPPKSYFSCLKGLFS